MQKFSQFLKEVNSELRKVTWPTKEELIGSTVVTVIVSLIMSIFIGLVDRVLTLIIKTVFGAGIGG